MVVARAFREGPAGMRSPSRLTRKHDQIRFQFPRFRGSDISCQLHLIVNALGLILVAQLGVHQGSRLFPGQRSSGTGFAITIPKLISS